MISATPSTSASRRAAARACSRSTRRSSGKASGTARCCGRRRCCASGITASSASATIGRAWSEPYQIRPHDSMLSEFADPRRAPEVLRVREQIRSWRFYDHIRTDAAAPARGSADRHQDAGAEPRRGRPRRRAADDPRDRRRRRPGRRPSTWPSLAVASPSTAKAEDGSGCGCTSMACSGRWARPSCRTARCATCCGRRRCSRPARPACWCSTSRRPACTGQLLAPLAQLIAAAGAPRSQVIAVSHSQTLITALQHATEEAGTPASPIELIKDFGETRVSAARSRSTGRPGAGRSDDPGHRAGPARSPQRELEPLVRGREAQRLVEPDGVRPALVRRQLNQPAALPARRLDRPLDHPRPSPWPR